MIIYSNLSTPLCLPVSVQQVRLLVLEGSQPLVQAGRCCGYLTEASQTGQSKTTAAHDCRLAALCDMAKGLPIVETSDATSVQDVKGHAEMDSHLDLFSCFTENPDDFSRDVTLMGEKYFLPPRCRFLLSDITRLQPLINCKFILCSEYGCVRKGLPIFASFKRLPFLCRELSALRRYFEIFLLRPEFSNPQTSFLASCVLTS